MSLAQAQTGQLEQTSRAHSLEYSSDSDEDGQGYGERSGTILRCPGTYCHDSVPEDPSEELKATLAIYIQLGKEKQPRHMVAANICMLVTKGQSQLQAFKTVEAEKWPATTLCFKDISS